MSIANSDFDIDILDDALTHPTIDFTFPLPTDKETYVDVEGNQKLTRNMGLMTNFINWAWGIRSDEIYNKNEYRYSVNKHTPEFNSRFVNYMNRQLEHDDHKVDELVYDLVDRELALKLISGSEFPKRFKEVKAFMVKYYQEQNKKNMPYFRSPFFVNMCFITVITVFRKAFPNGVWVKKSQFEALFKKYLEDPMSLIYLPNHQSHVDYIILHLISIRFQFSIPTVIAGENLNAAVLGGILRSLGAIFIKRSFSNEAYTERNLANIIEFVLTNKIHFEVFIEGTRSRDGKLLLPKYGLLKTLVDIYIRQRNERGNQKFNMLIQPISITYERIYETDGYLNEMIGSDKKQESMLRVLQNGLGNLVNGASKDDMKNIVAQIKSTGKYDNSTRPLHGKIFVNLGENFTMSSFVENKENLTGGQVNLKKLGFQVLHEVNRIKYFPEVTLVGVSIQTYYYFYNRNKFQVADVVPIMRVLLDTLLEEQQIDSAASNVKILKDIKNLSDEKVRELIKLQIVQFFRFIKVDWRLEIITIDYLIELLYYKNMIIHTVIRRCLVLYILLNLPAIEQRDASTVKMLYNIYCGILKNEFLFDYDYNEKNKLENVLASLVRGGHITENYEVLNRDYLMYFAEMVKPFIEAYALCVRTLIDATENFYRKVDKPITEEQLINDDLLSGEYPTTKGLLKIILTHKDSQRHIELINKQYLLSCLFYLANLQLIEIFKNKQRTRAFVLIRNKKDLTFLLDFLTNFAATSEPDETGKKYERSRVGYMQDIIEKNFKRNTQKL